MGRKGRAPKLLGCYFHFNYRRYGIMFAKRFWTQKAVYWTFLFTVLAAVTAFPRAQDTPANSSQIALDPSEMASIVGGSCNDCIITQQGGDCYGSLSCNPENQCANDGHCSSDLMLCFYRTSACDGAALQAGQKVCRTSWITVGRRLYRCFCNNGTCKVGYTTYSGTKCVRGPETC